MRHRRLLAIVAVALVGLLTPRSAEACSCVGGVPLCETFWKTPVVFAGQVLDIADAAADGKLLASRRVRFRVERSWRGEAAGEIDVFTGRGGGDCGYAFVRGEKYLVYANSSSGAFTTGICNPTKPIAEAGPDLEYFANAFKPSATGRIYGRAAYQQSETEISPRPIAGSAVTLTGDGKTWKTITAADGTYEFPNMLPGRYRVELTVPASERAFGGSRVELADPRGCAAADFYVIANGRISIRVLKPDRDPAPRVSVDVVQADGYNAQRSFAVRSVATDDDGRVEIGELRPGQYLVGVNLTRAPDARQPYPRRFYPGVAESAAARVVQVGLGELVDLDELVLPAPLAEQVISGVVKWPDGSPVRKASVALWMPLARQVGSGVTTDDDGRFQFKAHAGQRYHLTAFVDVTREPLVQWNGRSAEFEATADLGPVTIILQPPKGRQ